MTLVSREIRLKSRPVGMPNAGNFELASVTLPAPGAGEVQVKNLWMTVDPYMRGRMNDSRSYIGPFQLGEAMQGGAIGEVVASNDAGFKVGDIVQSMFGWREGYNAPASALTKVETHGLPLQSFLGAAGMPGLTAYAGLVRIAQMKDGDVVFVSGAAGAVGSVACQVAKLKGHTVIGSAGGPEKVKFLKDIGVDHAIDYKATPNLTKALLDVAPDGIDVYFDNVGGDILEACLFNMNTHGRIACCGAVSQYDGAAPPHGPRGVPGLIVTKRLTLTGFIVMDFDAERDQALAQLQAWVESGKLKVYEDVIDGFEHLPTALVGLLAGENIGKRMVRIR